jgi:peptidoglycan/xylan/chitin deacetylase (PgdA/CDA1 family)
MRAITLLFHDVVPAGQAHLSGMQGADADVYKLDCLEFRRHMQAVAEHLLGRPITAPELLSGTCSGNQVILTFDDGGVSAASYIADILDEFGWKGHFLITAGRIATPGFVNASQIRELQRRGHVIGSHTFSHPTRMSRCTNSELHEEWRESAATLSGIIGEPIQVASVPGGYYSPRVASSAAKWGIKLLFNSEPVVRSRSVDGCLVMGRFTLQHGDSPKKSAAFSVGAKQPRMQQYVFWNCKKVLKVLGGTAWLRARIWFLAMQGRNSARLESGSKTGV